MAVVSNQAFSIVNFRGNLIRDIVSRGVEVFAFAPDFDEALEDEVRGLGTVPVYMEMDRVGLNPIMALRIVWSLSRALRNLRIDAILSYFVKPVIYGGLAAKISGVRSVYSFIEGAGYVYSNEVPSISRNFLRSLVNLLYRVSLCSSSRVFLFNEDDYRLFVDGRLVDAHKVMRLPGIGLDLERFKQQEPATHSITFTFVGRLLREKGVADFVAAARLMKTKYPQIDFLIVGDTDENPDSIKREEMLRWVDEGIIHWVGKVVDVRAWLGQTSVLVHPSYYREGVPRSIQEAMATGRPVITTDSVGCRESIEHFVNGFLVPVKSPSCIAEAMERFVIDPQLIVRMGRESRRIAEVKFDVHKINEKVLACF